MAEPMIEVPTQVMPDPSAAKSEFEMAMRGEKPEVNEAEERAFNSLAEAFEKGRTAAVSEPGKEEKPAETKEVKPDATKKPDQPTTDRKLPPGIKSQPKEEEKIDLENMPFDKWPRNAKDWEKYRKSAVDQIQSLRKELDSARSTTQKPGVQDPGLADILKERDTLREELRAVAIERDPEFNAKFNNATEAIKASLQSIIGDEEAEKALDIFSQPAGKRRIAALEKLAEDMSPIKQNALTAAMLEHDKIGMAKKLELESARKNFDKIQLERKTQYEAQEQQRVKAFQEAFESTVNEWTDPEKGYDFVRKTGNKEADAKVDEIVSVAREIVSGQNAPDEMARAAMFAALSPRLIETVIAKDAEIEKLQAEIKNLKGSAPSFSSQPNFGAAGEPDEGMSYGEAMAKAIKAAGINLR